MLIVIIILASAILIWKFTPNNANKKAVGMMFQMLESFHIIDSTIQLEVFTQRLDFIGQLASALPANADKSKCVDMALQIYTHKYSNRPVSPTIRQIFNQPQIATSTKFRDEATTAFFLRTCNKLKTEIMALKTANSKQRRLVQGKELADIIIERLSSDERQKYIDCIYSELTLLSNLASPHLL